MAGSIGRAVCENSRKVDSSFAREDVGGEQDEGELGELRWLKVREPQADPPLASTHRVADPGEEHDEKQQGDGGSSR